MRNAGAPEGWYDDPTRRHERRYFDGTRWTDHVANGSVVGTDPIQPAARAFDDAAAAPAMPSTPPGPPAAATSAGWTSPAPTLGLTSTVAAPKRSFLDSLGPEATVRPDPDFPIAMGGIGGFLIGIGLVALISQSGDQAAVILAGVITFAAALAVVWFVVPKFGFLTSPAVTAAVVGIFATAVGLIVIGDDIPGPDAPFQVFLLGGLLCLVAWGVPGFRGRPLLLGVGLVALPLALAGLVAGAETCNSFDSECNVFESAVGSAGLSSGAGVVLALIGCALLFGVRKLDAIGRAGLATTVAAACIVNLVIGAVLLAVDLGSTGGPLLIAAAGVALGVVGHLGDRRGLTWTGAALAAGGLSFAVFDLVDTNSTTVGAIVFVVTGAVVIGVPYALSTRTSTVSRADMPPPSPDVG